MSCTTEQLNAMFDFLGDHKDLARGHLRSADGRLRAKRLWQDLTTLLNSLGGSVKTTQQWQKVWTDRKHLAKKNAAAARKSAGATGGGRGPEPILPWEMKVLTIMGEGFGAPETTARVPVFPVINFDNEVASYTEPLQETQAHPMPSMSASQFVEQAIAPRSGQQIVVQAGPSSAPELSADLRTEQQAGPFLTRQFVVQAEVQAGPSSAPHTQLPSVEQAGPSSAPHPHVEEHLPAQRNTLRAPFRRRRTISTSGNVSIGDRLFRYEEEKLEVMHAIRGELRTLTSVLKELVELKKKEIEK